MKWIILSIVFVALVITACQVKTGPGVDPYMAAARKIAQESSCTQVGGIGTFEVYNDNSKTYWFTLNATKEGCHPACVVYLENKSVEVNWRCTGLIPQQ